MLFLFRTNQVTYSILLLFYALVLRVSYFFNAYPVDMANDGVLSLLVKNWLGNNYIITGIITLVIVFIQALLINNIVNKHRLFRENTLFPGLFYILLVSSIQDFLPLSSILLGNTFLILAISNLLDIYKINNCADAIFNVGFWIGTAGLFYNAFILFLILAIFGLMVLRSFKLKEVLMVVCGYVLPFIFISVYYFWQDQFQDYWNNYFFNQFQLNLFNFRLSSGPSSPYHKLIVLIILFLMGIFNSYTFDKSYKIRNFMNLFYGALLISGLTFFFQNNIQISHFLIIAIPLSILLAARFLAMSTTTAEFIHLFIFIGIILFQFNVFNLN